MAAGGRSGRMAKRNSDILSKPLHTRCMTDRVQFSNEYPDGAWWRRELVQFDAEAKRWLRRKYPSIHHVHEDIVGETLLQLTSHLSTRPEILPPQWFEATGPAPDETWRFQAFAKTVLKRRVMDHFRADFRLWAQEIDTGQDDGQGSQPEPLANGPDAGSELDLVRTSRALIAMLARLPERDRLLMEEVALGGRDAPLDAGERQRVSRLRRQLLKELESAIGQNPKQLLKRL
jgi:DNA-directed RNA polymerase specialized sigma24 family protein